MRLLTLLLILVVCATRPAVAGPLDDGIAAYYKRDYAAALRLLRPLADQGDARAQSTLGSMYFGGSGVPVDPAAAATWFRKAAEQGDGPAQFALGSMYKIGAGVPQDYMAAARWLRKAADQDSVMAQTELGLMYEEGLGLPKDYAAAAVWYRKAAARGWLIAQDRLQALPIKAPNTNAIASSIQMKKEGRTYLVPVLINNAITLDFMVDSGASDVSIPEDVVSTLIRAGTIKGADFIGEQTYVLADGSKVKSKTFRIRSLKVGDRVLENVTGSVADRKGTLLLGQSFLGRFKSWSIDNSRHALVLE